MPYKIRWEGHGVYRHFFGEISATEFREAYEEMTGDVRYEGTRYIISDYLEAQPGADLTDSFIGRVAKLERLEYDSGPDIVHATVAAGDAMLAHIRSFETLPLAPYPERTFATVAEARQWIVANPRPEWLRAMRTR